MCTVTVNFPVSALTVNLLVSTFPINLPVPTFTINIPVSIFTTVNFYNHFPFSTFTTVLPVYLLWHLLFLRLPLRLSTVTTGLCVSTFTAVVRVSILAFADPSSTFTTVYFYKWSSCACSHNCCSCVYL